MAAVLNLYHALFVYHGLHIVPAGCHNGQGTEHIHPCNGLGCFLDADHLGSDAVPDLAEQVVFQGNQLFLGPHDDILQML